MNRNLASYQRIVVLTGAGISVASGLRPYRGPGGVWEEYEVERFGHRQALESDPERTWQLFGPMRGKIAAATPNAAHFALARFEASLAPTQEFLLVTQNVDSLHQRAGSRRVIELHGTLARTRCSSEDCSLEPYFDEADHVDAAPPCPVCGSALRPDVVLFGEPLPAYASWASKRALNECDLFLAIGTSGLVTPAANFVRAARYAGARTILINLEPMPPGSHPFDEEHLGRAEEMLPEMLGIDLGVASS